MAVVGLTTFAVALTAIGARATYGARTTADEPQYLITALSLGHDFDLDISDEIDRRQFLPFHEIDLNQQTIELNNAGQQLSPHDPLLPLLLAVPMRLGGWPLAKATLAATAAATAATTLWLTVRRADVGVGRASLIVGGFFAAPPLTAYATQVYPEMPAALCTVAGLIAVTSRLTDYDAEADDADAEADDAFCERSVAYRRLSAHRTVGAGAGAAKVAAVAVVSVVALPWLGIKYVPVAAVLALALLWRLRPSPARPSSHRSSRRRRWLPAGLAVVALVAAGLVYAVVHRRIYGGWTVYATGDHFVNGELLVVGYRPDYVGRSRRLVGLLVDREFGLVAWTPAFLLLAPALVSLVVTRLRACADRHALAARDSPPTSAKGRSAVWPVLLATFGAGWATATWIAFTMHGWWWPGRQLVVVLPIGVTAIAAYAARRRWAFIATLTGCALGIASWLWLVIEASTGRRTLVFDFAGTTNPWYQAWSRILPDHQTMGTTDLALTAIWTTLLLLAAAAVAVRSRRPAGPWTPRSSTS